MTLLIRNKSLNRQSLMLTAGLFLQAAGALAGETTADAQAQARLLLDPPPVVHLQAHKAITETSTNDVQAQARAILDPPVARRAKNIDSFTGAQADGQVTHRADAQEQARALLLGKPEEPSAAQAAIASDSTRNGALSILRNR